MKNYQEIWFCMIEKYILTEPNTFTLQSKLVAVLSCPWLTTGCVVLPSFPATIALNHLTL